jgi:hypothetical protein
MDTRIALITTLAVLASHAGAEENPLLGVWSGNDRASEAIYGRIEIGRKEIAWGGTNPYYPRCETTYTLVEHYRADAYPDDTFTLPSDRTFAVYKLELAPQPCTGSEGFFQFALPTDEADYAEVVTYRRDGSQTGWHNFSRVRGQPGIGLE